LKFAQYQSDHSVISVRTEQPWRKDTVWKQQYCALGGTNPSIAEAMIVRSILNARWVSSSPPELSGQTDPASAQQLDRSDKFCSITGHFKTSITRQLDSIVFALRTAEAVAAKISPKMAQTSHSHRTRYFGSMFEAIHVGSALAND